MDRNMKLGLRMMGPNRMVLAQSMTGLNRMVLVQSMMDVNRMVLGLLVVYNHRRMIQPVVLMVLVLVVVVEAFVGFLDP